MLGFGPKLSLNSDSPVLLLSMERSDTVSPLSIPSSYQVLHKLKEWDESQNDSNDSDQSAQFQQQLFSMLKSLRHSIPKFTHDPTYDPDLHNESAPRVSRFLAASRCYKPEWQEMGFLLPSEGFGSSSSSSSSRPRRKEEFGIMQIRSLAAHTTVAILAELGLPCAIFGSMACKLYGNQRIPNVRFLFLSFCYFSKVSDSSSLLCVCRVTFFLDI